MTVEAGGSTGKALLAYGMLSRRLKADWVLLRDCRIATAREQYAVQLVMIHRDFGIALIAFRDETYTFPDIAMRLTREFLLQEGFRERFAGLPPIVFITAGEGEAREVPGYIARAFAAEAANTIADPEWADWSARVLARTAAEHSQGRAEDSATDAPVEFELCPNEPVKHRRRALCAVSAAALILALAGGGAFVHRGRTAADPPAPPAAATQVSATARLPEWDSRTHRRRGGGALSRARPRQLPQAPRRARAQGLSASGVGHAPIRPYRHRPVA